MDPRGQRLRPMAAVAPRPSAAVSGQADEASAPRGGGIPPGSGHQPNSSAPLGLCCFLGARVLVKPIQQVSPLGRLVESKRAAPQRRGQPALRVSTAAQTGLNVVHHIETPPVPLLEGGEKKKGKNTRRWCENPFVAISPVMTSLSLSLRVIFP